ncbi:MAG TPA: SUMF1/EgtB/PvdO family nonheme iron enzyme [Kiritimatiellia bacterium]|jgi:formylglycine-generating enzyme required for sulfatase activity
MRTGAALLSIAALALMIRRPSWTDFATVPAGNFRAGSPESAGANPAREVRVDAFSIGRTEITCAEFSQFLNATGARPSAQGEHQFEQIGTKWFARDARRPVAWVSLDDARAYCAWRSGVEGRRVRLPTADEWECAARGGIDGARFPWGWGEPAGRACFGADGPQRVASFRANPGGLFDAAGNVAEWCEPENRDTGFQPVGPAATITGRMPVSHSDAPALGGSWADRDPDFLRVFHRADFPRDYRDGDVGFRAVAEAL